MELRMPGAVWKPGPISKTGYGGVVRGPKRGDVKHSAEGWRANIMPILEGPRRASWHFTVLTDRTIWQHYEIDVWCWHAGDADDDGAIEANQETVGIEHEGVAGTPLNADQIAATAEITQFCAEQFGRARDFARYPIQPSDGWTLVEHNQVSDHPTACPSNRIPWALVLDRLHPQQEEDDMTFIGRAKDNDPQTPYKTYMLFVSSDGGLHKQHIPDAETAAALEAAGIPLRTMSKQELARYRDA